jgi:hypothetical protein
MSPNIPSQAKVSRKRKRVINFDAIIEAFNVEPKDYEAAWNDLRARITESSMLGCATTVGLCVQWTLKAIGLRFVSSLLQHLL